jgi:hypothetical protein
MDSSRSGSEGPCGSAKERLPRRRVQIQKLKILGKYVFIGLFPLKM